MKMSYSEEEIIKQSQGIFGDLMKKFAKSIYLSNVYGLFIPVKTSECRSFVERVADFFRTASFFVKKAPL